jgi:hypothetical protein
MKHLLLSLIFLLPLTISAQVTDEQIQKLLASDGAADDVFGHSVSISGNYAIVGAMGDDDNGNESGSAYIYYKDRGGTGNWGEVKKITASDGAADDSFGESVSISGNYATVGAYVDDDNGTNSGSAYIFGPSMPTVTSQPVHQTNMCSGSTAEYSLTGSDIDNYKWQVSTDGGSSFSNISNGNVYSGVQNDTLTVTVDQSLNSYKYRCKVTNANYPALVSNHLKRFYSDTVRLTTDQQAPSITTQNAVVSLNASGTCSITPADVVSNASDNCGVSDTTLSQSAFSCSDMGTVTINVTVADGAGNTDTQTADVTVEDAITPELTTHDTTVYIDAQGGAAVYPEDVVSGATDNCTLTDTTLSQSLFSCDDLGVVTIDITVNDSSGNKTTRQADVFVEDTTRPALTTRDTTICLDAAGNAGIRQSDVISAASDNCEILDTLLSQMFFACSDTGKTTINVTVNDVNGNSSIQTADVTVKDTISPVFSISDTTLYIDTSGQASLKPGEVVTGVTDNCALADTVLSQSSFTCSDTGQTTITVTVKDISNNSDTQRLGVIVKDTIKPTLSCPSDQTVDADDSGTYTVQGDELDLESYEDNCSITRITNDFNESQTLADAKIPVGNHDMNWEVIDASGNTQTCSFDLVVSEYTSITGMNEAGIKVYPNPTDGKLQIESGETRIKQLTLTSLSGKEVIVKTQVESHETIDLTGLATGVYILRIQSDGGLFTIKIIHK